MLEYFVEFMGTLIVVYSLLLTDRNPAIMGLIYFAVYTVAGEMSGGTFNPLGAAAYYMIGRTTLNEMLMNIAAQLFAMEAAVLSFVPIKALIGDF
uniref:Major intrinsic protein n=1 Tax=viral metagenome TaxID=1070528 RepID=A0A6C0AIG4_9ZZZZ